MELEEEIQVFRFVKCLKFEIFTTGLALIHCKIIIVYVPDTEFFLSIMVTEQKYLQKRSLPSLEVLAALQSFEKSEKI